MKAIYLDLGMGAAGDMLTAAFYELLDETQKKTFIEKVNSFGIEGVSVEAEKAEKFGITGTHMKVLVDGEEEDDHDHHHEEHHHDGEHHNGDEDCHDHDHIHDHEHEHHHDDEDCHEHDHEHGHHHDDEEHHDHNHEHHHHHSTMADTETIINSMDVSDEVKKNAIEVYNLIAEAESHAHGKPVTEIHFHEVGTKDAIVDVVSVCLLVEMLGADKITASPVHVGSGHVHCAHGILPVPAPATAFILQGVPIYGGEIEGELCTPTGAALLKHFVSEYGEMKQMSVSTIGYGMGKKDFPRANCVRALMGEDVSNGNTIVELSCNVDDMTAENIGFALERFFEAGAVDAYTIPIGMKKSRPGVMICVMCSEKKRDEMVGLIFKYTTTLGIRENISRRYTLERRTESVKTSLGDVRVKRSEGYGVTREKYEYEDLAGIAKDNNMSIGEVVEVIKTEV